MGYSWDIPSGDVKIASENGDLLRGFSHEKMVDLSIAKCKRLPEWEWMGMDGNGWDMYDDWIWMEYNGIFIGWLRGRYIMDFDDPNETSV